MGTVNYLLGLILIDAISIQNFYIRIIVFGVILYILNLMVLAIIQQKSIYKTLARRRQNEKYNKDY